MIVLVVYSDSTYCNSTTSDYKEAIQACHEQQAAEISDRQEYLEEIRELDAWRIQVCGSTLSRLPAYRRRRFRFREAET